MILLLLYNYQFLIHIKKFNKIILMTITNTLNFDFEIQKVDDYIFENKGDGIKF